MGIGVAFVLLISSNLGVPLPSRYVIIAFKITDHISFPRIPLVAQPAFSDVEAVRFRLIVSGLLLPNSSTRSRIALCHSKLGVALFIDIQDNESNCLLKVLLKQKLTFNVRVIRVIDKLLEEPMFILSDQNSEDDCETMLLRQ